MIRAPRTLAAVALALATLLAAAGCGGTSPGASPAPSGSGAPAAPSAPAAGTKVSIAWVAISGSQIPIWVTYDGGYFKQQGLDVEMQYVAGGASTMQALVSGQDQFATFGDTEVVDANAEKIPVVAVASSVDRPLFQVIGGKGIDSFAQLKGKKLGVTQIGSVGYYVAETGIKANHMGATDTTLFQIPAQPDLLSALMNGSIQAATLVPPFTFKAVDAGLKVLYDPAKEGIWGAMSNLDTTATFIKQHPDIVQKVVTAYTQGTKRALDDPAFAIQSIEKWGKQDEALAKRTYDSFKPFFASPPAKNVKALQDMVAFVAESNAKAKGLDPASMMDMQFVQKAGGS